MLTIGQVVDPCAEVEVARIYNEQILPLSDGTKLVAYEVLFLPEALIYHTD